MLGRRLTQHLLAERAGEVEIRWLTRSPVEMPNSVSRFHWDGVKEIDVAAFEKLDSCIYLAGYPLANGRLDEAHKEKCVQSRIGGVEFLAKHLPATLESFVGASAIGWYGLSPAETPLEESAPPGNDFAARLCRDWEKSYNLISAKRKTIVRIPPVLSPSGGAYPQMAFPAKFGLSAAL